MELQSLIYLFVAISFTIYFGVALWSKASSTKDFYIVKNTNRPSLNGVSIAVDFISAATFLSFAGVFLYSYSITNYFIAGIIFGFLFLAFIIVPNLRKEAELSIPTFLDNKYSSIFIKKLSAIIVLIICFLYLNAQMKASGIIFARIFQIDVTVALFFSLALTFIYSLISGKKRVSYSFILQYIIIFISFSTPIIFLTISLTNSYFPQFSLLSSLKDGSSIMLELKNSLNSFHIEQNSSLINNLLLSLSVALGVATLPHIIIKFFTTSSVKNSKRSAIWGLFFIIIIYSFIISLPALSAINFSKNLSTFEYSIYVKDEFSLENGKDLKGSWLKTWQDINLIKFKDKNDDDKISLNELKINPDTVFLINSEMANMPNWIIALVISGALAATLSTIIALLLLIKATLVNEFLSTNKKIAKFRVNSLLLLLLFLATIFQIGNYTILQTVSLAFSLGAATLFPTLILTIFKNIDKKSIFFGLFTATIFMFFYTLLYLLDIKYFNFINPESIGFIGALLNFSISIFASKYIFNKENSSIHKEKK